MHIVYTPNHWHHDTRDLFVNGQYYPIEELPERVESLLKAVQQAGIGPILQPEDYGLAPLLSVHSQAYIEFLSTIFARASAFNGAEQPLLPETFSSRSPLRCTAHPIGQLGYYCFGTYSPILRGTWEAAYWSAQCALTAAHITMETRETTYAMCRPPGHHAGKELYGGFCYLNNAAIAGRALKARTAILDIDFHHGNGTQEIFYEDPEIFFCSIHADPDHEYPYFWGSAEELGAGAGTAATVNYPLPLGTNDRAYLETLDLALKKVLLFEPAYLIVSTGFDIMAGDPAGGFKITPTGLDEIARRIAVLTHQGIPTVIIQEGGYLLDTLGETAVRFLTPFSH